MADLIGATATLPEVVGRSFKQQLLLFDRIACPAAPRYFREFQENPESTHPSLLAVAPGLGWLMEKGVVFAPEWKSSPLSAQELMQFTAYAMQRTDLARAFRSLDSTYAPESQPLLAEAGRGFAGVMVDIESRQLAAHLRTQNQNAVPLTSSWPQIDTPATEVIEIVVKELPIPGENHSFEDILAFRDEAHSQDLIPGLRVWMNEMGSGTLTQIEVSDKLEDLISRYEKALKLEKMSRDTGVVETIVVTTAEIAESLVKFRWTDMAKKLFEVRHKKIDLVKAEMTAPGHEVAYIVKARERFGG